jgi:hypothetical protein
MSSNNPKSTNPTLAETNPWIRDADARRQRFLDVAERNSVIEGLPPFSDEFRAELLEEVKNLSSRDRGQRE